MHRLPFHRPHRGLSLQLSYTSHGPAPGDMWVAPLQVAQFLSRAPTVHRSAPHCRSILTPFPRNPHLRRWPSPIWPPPRPHHLHLALSPFISFHPWSGGFLPPPLTNNNMLAVAVIGCNATDRGKKDNRQFCSHVCNLQKKTIVTKTPCISSQSKAENTHVVFVIIVLKRIHLL